MTLILWGSIISIVGALAGGLIVAVGKYKQDQASSQKSDTILLNIEQGLGITTITKDGVIELIEQKNRLDNQVKSLLLKQDDLKQGQDTLTDKLEPFISYAHKLFPNVNTDEALIRLEDLLNTQGKQLKETNERVDDIGKEVIAEKQNAKPQLTMKIWGVQNQKVNTIPKGRRINEDIIEVKEKFKLDYVFFNEFEFEYKTVINRSEFTFLLNKDDVVFCTISIKNGVINTQEAKRSDGKMGFRLNQPQNGLYVLRIYSKSELYNIDSLLLIQ